MSNVVRIRHTSGAKQRLENAHKVMGLANEFSNQLEDIFNNWAKVKVADNEVKKMIQFALCPNKETFNILRLEMMTKYPPYLKIQLKMLLPIL